MAEPRKVYPGERLPGYPSEAHNLFLDTSKKVQGLPDAIFRPGFASSAPALSVEVFNDTGGDLTATRPIIKISGPKFDYDDAAAVINGAVAASGAAPAGGEEIGQWGVADGPVADGASVALTISGHAWCQVNVTDAAHTHAAPAASDTDKLASGTSGARILWKQSGTGTKWAWVYLGGGAGDSADIIYARVNNTGGTAADTNLYNYDSGISITGCATAASTGQFRNNGQVLDDNLPIVLFKRQDTGEYEPEQAGEPAILAIGSARVNVVGGVTNANTTFAFDQALGKTAAFSATDGTATNLHLKAFRNDERILLIEDSGNTFYAVKVEVDIIYATVSGGSVADTALDFTFDNAVAVEGWAPDTTTGTAKNVCGLAWEDNELFIAVLCDDGEWLPIKQAEVPGGIGKALINNAGGYTSGSATVAYDTAFVLYGSLSAAAGTAANAHHKAFRDNEEILLVEDGAGNVEAIKVEVDIQKATVNDATDVAPTDTTFDFDGGTTIEGVEQLTGTARNDCGLAWSDDEDHLQILADNGQWLAIKQHDACVFFADAAEDVAATDTDFSADGIVRFMNKEPGVTEPITVKNTIGATFADNDKIIVARDYLGEYEVLSVIAQTCVIFRCKPGSNLTGESSFTGGTLTEVFGTPPAGPTETINNPLALYSTTAGWITCVVKTDGTFEAIYAEEHVQQWLKAQSGYNAANEQGFTHNAGTFTWVDIDDTCP